MLRVADRLYPLLKPWLFLLPPELAHLCVSWGLKLLAILSRPFSKSSSRSSPNPLQAPFGSAPLPSPVGIAAGMVKDPLFLEGFLLLMPGFIEIGTLTRYPQSGNPHPRIKRLSSHQALWNHLGFPNPGYHRGLLALKTIKCTPRLWIGVNLSKGSRTPSHLALLEILEGIRLFFPFADFFVLNWASPNTPGLRDLLTPRNLEVFATNLAREKPVLEKFYGKTSPPVLVKIHPDLPPERGDELLKTIATIPLDGVVAINTTLRRTGLGEKDLPTVGGISGQPLKELRDFWCERALALLPKEKIILACGGISTHEEIQRLVQKGIYGVEIYTALVFQGPSLLRVKP